MAQTQVRLLPGAYLSPAGVGVAANASGGTFAANTYFWKTTFLTDFGETEASNEVTVAIVLNGTATISWPTPPAGIRAVNIYRGTASNGENALVGQVGLASDVPSLVQLAGPFIDTGGAGTAQTPPAVTNFTNVALDSAGRVLDSDTILASLPTTAQLLQAIAAAEEWQNSAGTSVDAQNNANAVGVALNWA